MVEDEEIEQAFEKIMFSDESLEELEEELGKVYEEGGLSTISHVYGLNQRVNQFEEVFQAYKEFYAVRDFREGSDIKDRKLHNLMESYRNYFGPGSNEQWNQGVETAQAFMNATDMNGPLTRDDFYEILSGEYE